MCPFLFVSFLGWGFVFVIAFDFCVVVFCCFCCCCFCLCGGGGGGVCMCVCATGLMVFVRRGYSPGRTAVGGGGGGGGGGVCVCGRVTRAATGSSRALPRGRPGTGQTMMADDLTAMAQTTVACVPLPTQLCQQVSVAGCKRRWCMPASGLYLSSFCACHCVPLPTHT